MGTTTEDARLRELRMLSALERGPVTLTIQDYQDPALKSFAVHVLSEGLANGLDCVPVVPDEPSSPRREFGGKSALQLKHEVRLWGEIALVLANQQVILRISHKGRVRRAELEQALRTGRDMEPFGVLWADRYRQQAVTMAVLEARPDSSVSVAYLDMNGLKNINDGNDHHAGDVAIRTYLQTIAMVVGDKGEGFRGGSSDEAVVVMPCTSADDARSLMCAVLRQLGKEGVRVDGREIVPLLTASCGIASTSDANADPAALIRRADVEQQRAKRASKQAAGTRPSFLAVEGSDLELVT